MNWSREELSSSTNGLHWQGWDCESVFKKVVSVLAGTYLLQCNFCVIAFTLLLLLRLSSPIPSSHSPFIPSALSFLCRGLCILKKIKTNIFRAEREQEKGNYNIAQLSFLTRWRDLGQGRCGLWLIPLGIMGDPGVDGSDELWRWDPGGYSLTSLFSWDFLT